MVPLILTAFIKRSRLYSLWLDRTYTRAQFTSKSPVSAAPMASTSTIPPETKELISQIEVLLHNLGVALHKLRKLCPPTEEVSPIRALVDAAEARRTEILANVRMIRDRLRVPFTFVETDFDNEWVDRMQPGIVEARGQDGHPFLRGEVQHGPVADVAKLGRNHPYSLSVEYQDDSDYAEWRAPYKVQFTPEPHCRDSQGRPFPAVCVNVNEKGSVQGSYKQTMLHKETGLVLHGDEKTLMGPVPAESVRWKLRPEKKNDTSAPPPRVVGSAAAKLISRPPVARFDDELEN